MGIEYMIFYNPVDYNDLINTEDYLYFYNPIIYEVFIGEE